MNQQGAMEVLAGMLVCIGAFLLIYLVIYILFVLNLHRTLEEVAERNRAMSPGLVWLIFIPLFNIIWAIIMVSKIAQSLRNEFEDRGWSTHNEGFARMTGMIWAWGAVVNIALSIMQNAAQFANQQPVAMLLGLLGCPLGLTIFVCWIIYWVQTHQYKVRLREGHRGYRSGSVEADYDDDYRPRRSRFDDDERSRDRDEDAGGGDFNFDRPARRDDNDDEDDRPRRREREDY